MVLYSYISRCTHILNKLIDNVIIIIYNINISFFTPFCAVFTLFSQHCFKIVNKIIAPVGFFFKKRSQVNFIILIQKREEYCLRTLDPRHFEHLRLNFRRLRRLAAVVVFVHFHYLLHQAPRLHYLNLLSLLVLVPVSQCHL